MKEMTAIDLFCGAGGLSEGFQQAGFTILAGNDFDEHAGVTFSLAHDTAEFLPGPIEEISADHVLKVTGLKKGELDCLIGGPPCQAFSVYNHQRGLHDKRSRLFEEYLRVVRGLAPKWGGDGKCDGHYFCWQGPGGSGDFGWPLRVGIRRGYAYFEGRRIRRATRATPSIFRGQSTKSTRILAAADTWA